MSSPTDIISWLSPFSAPGAPGEQSCPGIRLPALKLCWNESGHLFYSPSQSQSKRPCCFGNDDNRRTLHGRTLAHMAPFTPRDENATRPLRLQSTKLDFYPGHFLLKFRSCLPNEGNYLATPKQGYQTIKTVADTARRVAISQPVWTLIQSPRMCGQHSGIFMCPVAF